MPTHAWRRGPHAPDLCFRAGACVPLARQAPRVAQPVELARGSGRGRAVARDGRARVAEAVGSDARAMQAQVRRSKEEAAAILKGYESTLREAEREGGCACAQQSAPASFGRCTASRRVFGQAAFGRSARGWLQLRVAEAHIRETGGRVLRLVRLTDLSAARASAMHPLGHLFRCCSAHRRRRAAIWACSRAARCRSLSRMRRSRCKCGSAPVLCGRRCAGLRALGRQVGEMSSIVESGSGLHLILRTQ